MDKKNIKKIIESYMTGETSEEVRMTFDKWLTDGVSSEEKEDALNEIWDNMTLTPVSDLEDPVVIIEEAEMIQNIENRRSSRGKSVMLWVASSVAACLAIVAFIGWNNPVKSDTTCLITSVDSKGEFLLPDGSVVWLNKGSRLYYEDDLKAGNVR